MTFKNVRHLPGARTIWRSLLACGCALSIATDVLAAQKFTTESPLSAAEPRPVALGLKFSQQDKAAPIVHSRSCQTVVDVSVSAHLETCRPIFSAREHTEQETMGKTPLGPYLVMGALTGAAVGAGAMYLHLQNCDACFFGEVAMIGSAAAGALVGTLAGLVVYSFVDDRRRRQQESVPTTR